MKRDINFLKKIYIKIISQIIVWAIFLSIPFFLRPPFETHEKFPVFIIIHWLFLIIFYYINYYVFVPKFLYTNKILLYITISIGCIVAYGLLPEIAGNMHSRPLLRDAPPGSFIFAKISSIALFLLIYITSICISLINKLFETIKEKQQIEIEKTKAELAFLKSQVNPHFLFNTLYSIYYLSLEKSDKTPKAILKLSDIMRFVLTESQCDYIPLQKEIDYINMYIDLQKLRISEKTKVILTFTGKTGNRQIAPLLLVPFVENAFKYGVSSYQNTTIEITLQMNSPFLELEVVNQKFSVPNEIESSNIGLENVMHRLQLLYPQKHRLDLRDEEGRYAVKLKIDLS